MHNNLCRLLFVLSDIDLKSRLRRTIFLFHFHRLSVSCLLLFGRQRFLIAWSLVHKGSVVDTELLPHPLGAGSTGRGGEGLRTGCALRRLEVLQPSVVVQLADAAAVLCLHSLHCAAISDLHVLLLAQRSLHSATADAGRTATDTPCLRRDHKPCEPHSTQRSTRAAYTQTFSLGHSRLQKSKPCNRNGEICSRAVCQQ